MSEKEILTFEKNPQSKYKGVWMHLQKSERQERFFFFLFFFNFKLAVNGDVAEMLLKSNCDWMSVFNPRHWKTPSNFNCFKRENWCLIYLQPGEQSWCFPAVYFSCRRWFHRLGLSLPFHWDVEHRMDLKPSSDEPAHTPPAMNQQHTQTDRGMQRLWSEVTNRRQDQTPDRTVGVI